MEAALALEALIDHQPGADAVLQPHAAPIIGQLLDAMRRTVSEELNTVLCKVFLRHAKHIGPLATSIVQQLGDAFTRLHGEDADTAGLDDAVEEDRMLLAMGLLDTLADVTDAVRRSDARLLSQLEPLLINIVKFIFDANLAEFHEQAAALAHRLVRRRTLSPTVWQLLSIIGAYIARDGDFVDTFVEFVATLHCLVTASSDGSGGDLLAEASRPAQLLAICERILGEDTSCEEAQEGAARLLETALLQFPGRLDQGFVQRALTAAAKRMELQAASASAQSAAASTASEDVALACLRVCLAGLLHWPELALSLLPADQLVASYERLHRRLVCLHDRRLCVLAFCSLLSLRPDLAKPLLPALLRLFSGLRASYRLKARLEADGDCGDGDSSDGEGESEEAGDSSRAAAAVVAAPQRELDSDEDEAFEDQSAAEADQTDAGLGDALGNGVGDQVDDGQDSADPDGLDNLDDLGRPPFSTRLERPLDAADALRLDEFLAVSRTVPAVCPPDALAALDAEAASCLNYVLAEAESRQRQAAANSASLP
uniref:CAS_CSE1 domain-containing protein n=3 Tax=Macrostomum lignano TaxID=282301 RepID=A0A1I8IA23_9PLAT